jgi:hypothetical protein
MAAGIGFAFAEFVFLRQMCQQRYGQHILWRRR